MAAKKGAKGYHAEEALRSYFLSLGYFVVRGVAFRYRGFEVTDIDLWLYLRSSSVSRERAIVDVKRKRTPQALERVFWAKGLQDVLQVDKCIVATSDNRQATRDFGTAHGVTVLHGDFLQRTLKAHSQSPERLTEESFGMELKTPCVLERKVVWSRFYSESKSSLLTSLNFNGCNLFLKKIHFLMQEYLACNKSSTCSLRLLYVLISYFLVAVDHISRVIGPLEAECRQRALAEGFRYGDAGQARGQEIIDTALQLLSESSERNVFPRAKLEHDIKEQLSTYPAEVLAEFLAKADNMKQAFSLARDCEKLAFFRNVPSPGASPVEIKSLMGLLCDFFGLERRDII